MREPKIDEIWYTWSSVGLSGATAGYRVRAASDGLSNLHGQRYKSIDRYLRYQLPQGVNPHTVSIQDAPICLALINTGQERILVHKVYKGRDAAGRPGNYFIHLLAGLPVYFSARDAIRLWGASLWQVDDVSLEHQPTSLDGFSIEELFQQVDKSSLTFDISKLKKHLILMIRAFLSPGIRPQHLYIAGHSQNIATLIWGLTHSLPTNLLSDLTFSTYEYDIRTCRETIVGTITPEDIASPNHAKVLMKFTPAPDPSSDTSVDDYASYAVQYLIQRESGQSSELNDLVVRAEALKISTVEEFMELFKQSIAKKEPVQLIHDLLHALDNVEQERVAEICDEFTILFPPISNQAAWKQLWQALEEEPYRERVIQDKATLLWLFSSLVEIAPQPDTDELNRWLSGSWHRLGALLSLEEVSKSWREEAIAVVLLTPRQERLELNKVVKNHGNQIVNVLQQLVINHDVEYSEAVIDFLTAWEPGHQQKKRDLATFLANTRGIHPEIQRQLLSMFQLDAPVVPKAISPPFAEPAILTRPTVSVSRGLFSILGNVKTIALGLLARAIRWSKGYLRTAAGIRVFIGIIIVFLLFSHGLIYYIATSQLNRPAIRATAIAQTMATVSTQAAITAQLHVQATATAQEGHGKNSYKFIGFYASPPKVKVNKQITIYLTLQNNGDTTWSDNRNYTIVCIPVPGKASDPDCSGKIFNGFMGDTVLPQHTYTFTIILTPDPKPELHTVQLTLAQNDVPFNEKGEAVSFFVTQ